MKKTSQKTALYGLFTAVAILFGYVEFMLPLTFIAPGVKLGLANAVFLLLLLWERPRAGFGINLVRILLSALLFATPFSLFFSLSGGLCSMIVMRLLFRTKCFSPIGLSVAGSVAHNLCQLVVAQVTVGTGVWFYLPFLLLSGMITGGLIGLVCIWLQSKSKLILKWI